MANNPPPIQEGVTSEPTGLCTQVWIRWFQDVARRILGLEDLTNVLLRMAPSGMIDPENTGTISINATDNTTFDLTASQLQFVDAYTDAPNPTLTIVDVDAQTGVSVPTISTGGVSFIYIDTSGGFVFSNVLMGNDFLRDHVGVGILTHPDLATLSGAEQASLSSISNTTMSLADLSFCQLGINCSFGGRNIISGNSGTLGLNTSGGCFYYHGIDSGFNNKAPNIIDSPQINKFSMLQGWKTTDGSGETLIIQDTIIAGVYDDGTAVQSDTQPQGTVTSGQWVNHRIFKIINENRVGETQFIMQYGQVKYNSSASAQIAIPLEQFDILDTFLGVTPVATVTMRGGATDLTNTSDAVFKQATPPRATF